MASATDTARATIEGRLKTNMASGSGTAIAWPNVPFEPPDKLESFIESVILWGEGSGITKNGRNTLVGVLNINVFSIAGRGFGPLNTIADEIRDIFNRVEVSGVRFGIPTAANPATSDKTKWVQGNISIPFTVDEVLT